MASYHDDYSYSKELRQVRSSERSPYDDRIPSRSHTRGYGYKDDNDDERLHGQTYKRSAHETHSQSSDRSYKDSELHRQDISKPDDQPSVEEFVKSFLQTNSIKIPGFENTESTVDEEDKYLYGDESTSQSSIQQVLQGALKHLTGEDNAEKSTRIPSETASRRSIDPDLRRNDIPYENSRRREASGTVRDSIGDEKFLRRIDSHGMGDRLRLMDREGKFSEKSDEYGRDGRLSEKSDMQSTDFRLSERADMFNRDARLSERSDMFNRDAMLSERADAYDRETRSSERADMYSRDVRLSDKADMHSRASREAGQSDIYSRDDRFAERRDVYGRNTMLSEPANLYAREGRLSDKVDVLNRELGQPRKEGSQEKFVDRYGMLSERAPGEGHLSAVDANQDNRRQISRDHLNEQRGRKEYVPPHEELTRRVNQQSNNPQRVTDQIIPADEYKLQSKEEGGSSENPSLEGILKSIGFNFEMSQSMQERAKKEREIKQPPTSNNDILPNRLANDLISSLDEVMKKKQRQTTTESYEERAKRYLMEKQLAQRDGRESPVPFTEDGLPVTKRKPDLRHVLNELSKSSNLEDNDGHKDYHETISRNDEDLRKIGAVEKSSKKRANVDDVDMDFHISDQDYRSALAQKKARTEQLDRSDVDMRSHQAFGKWDSKPSRWDSVISKKESVSQSRDRDLRSDRHGSRSPLLNIRITTTQDNSKRKIIEDDTSVMHPSNLSRKRSAADQQKYQNVNVAQPVHQDKLRQEKEERQKRLDFLEEELKKLRKQKGDIIRVKERQRVDIQQDSKLDYNNELQNQISAQIHAIRQQVESKMISKSSMDDSKKISEDIKGEIYEQSDKNSHRKMENKKKFLKKSVINYQYFDPCNHWCKSCNAMQGNVYDFFRHLASRQHKQNQDPYDRPWMTDYQVKETPKTGQIVAAPFKGVEFLMPVDAIYCRLCKTFLGGNTCAEDHLKSEAHNNAYEKFIEADPQYEKKFSLDKAAGMAMLPQSQISNIKSKMRQKSRSRSPVKQYNNQISEEPPDSHPRYRPPQTYHSRERSRSSRSSERHSPKDKTSDKKSQQEPSKASDNPILIDDEEPSTKKVTKDVKSYQVPKFMVGKRIVKQKPKVAMTIAAQATVKLSKVNPLDLPQKKLVKKPIGKIVREPMSKGDFDKKEESQSGNTFFTIEGKSELPVIPLPTTTTKKAEISPKVINPTPDVISAPGEPPKEAKPASTQGIPSLLSIPIPPSKIKESENVIKQFLSAEEKAERKLLGIDTDDNNYPKAVAPPIGPKLPIDPSASSSMSSSSASVLYNTFYGDKAKK